MSELSNTFLPSLNSEYLTLFPTTSVDNSHRPFLVTTDWTILSDILSLTNKRFLPEWILLWLLLVEDVFWMSWCELVVLRLPLLSSSSFCFLSSSLIRIFLASYRACRLAASLASAWNERDVWLFLHITEMGRPTCLSTSMWVIWISRPSLGLLVSVLHQFWLIRVLGGIAVLVF